MKETERDRERDREQTTKKAQPLLSEEADTDDAWKGRKTGFVCGGSLFFASETGDDRGGCNQGERAKACEGARAGLQYSTYCSRTSEVVGESSSRKVGLELRGYGTETERDKAPGCLARRHFFILCSGATGIEPTGFQTTRRKRRIRRRRRRSRERRSRATHADERGCWPVGLVCLDSFRSAAWSTAPAQLRRLTPGSARYSAPRFRTHRRDDEEKQKRVLIMDKADLTQELLYLLYFTVLCCLAYKHTLQRCTSPQSSFAKGWPPLDAVLYTARCRTQTACLDCAGRESGMRRQFSSHLTGPTTRQAERRASGERGSQKNMATMMKRSIQLEMQTRYSTAR